MKTINVRDLQKKLRECVDTSQKERVVITRHGRPAAVLIGVEGQDWEDVVLETSAEFWKMIGERRREETVPLREARKRLEARWTKGRAGRKPGRSRRARRRVTR
jgi:prevent-host-death family protein